MCSIFVSTTTTNMDNYQGDLTDILRASSTANSGGGTSSASDHQQPAAATASLQQHHHDNHHHHHHRWNNNHHQHFSSSDNSMSFSSILQDPREGGINYFGDPFSTLRDPFLQELDLPTPTPSYFTTSTTTNTIISTGLEQQLPSAATSSSSVFGHNKVVLEDPTILQHEMRSSSVSSTSRPCKNIFSNMIQISPNPNINTTKLLPYDAPSPRPIKPSVVLSPNITINAANKDSLLDNNNTAGIQISSSRNTGLKRRKNLAKKVVCIPAPAAANSRQTGEVVPSDLWAWRKYGQKPIKGSPYPRGYYRCSSSKGCSARKQVERSRTDPNMLVITYTSEHNHPWPTQRNALAGSTRSQPSKSNPSQKNSETSQKGSKNPKEEENNNSDGNNNSTVVKEEMEDIEKQIEMDDGEFSDGAGVLPYKSSSLMENNLPHEDFFAELGELEGDPLNLLFNQGFGTNDHQKESKALDPFHLFDWSENSNNSNSFEEPNKRRL